MYTIMTLIFACPNCSACNGSVERQTLSGLANMYPSDIPPEERCQVDEHRRA